MGPWYRHRLILSAHGSLDSIEIGLWQSGAADIEEALLKERDRLAMEIEQTLNRVADYLSGDQFRRHSSLEAAHHGVADAIDKSTGRLVQECLSERVRSAWERLARCKSIEGLEEARTEANDTYVRHAVAQVKQQVALHLERAPTDEQARAIATDEDATLVLASAGSGKTTAILGKIAHLIESGVPPHEILVLAFNRKAVEEIKERLSVRLDGIDVATFHSFGSRVMGEVEGARPSVSVLAENEAFRRAEINRYLQELLVDPECPSELQSFLLYHLGEYASPFDFDSMGEYHDYVRRSGLRTLNGELVKSFEELEIANFLAIQGVSYQYEADYQHKTASSAYRQYRPDFYLPDYDLYIEHFGVDRDGQPPKEWGERACQRYVEGMKWKRNVHHENGTELIETFSWQRMDGNLTNTLRELLKQRRVDFQRIEQADLLKRLGNANLISRFADLVDSFLNHVKTSGVRMEQLEQVVNSGLDQRQRERARLFLAIFRVLFERYERELGSEIDFHHMINSAEDLIANGHWPSPYRYVLVDEYQDIALNRMKLIAALRQQGAAYFLVGDDWQSINRFAGSDMTLMADTEQYLGFVQQRHLERTFRFGPKLLHVSSTFIRQNPLQSQRAQVPQEVPNEEGVCVVARAPIQANDREQWRQKNEAATAELVRRIVADIYSLPAAASKPSILLLGRYSFSRPDQLKSDSRIDFNTVHRAKGREADFVIVLGLDDNQYGFPSQILDDPLLELVTPSRDEFEFAEERRLFYVAMTRARRGVYLIADANRPSRFVRELVARHGAEIDRIGELAFDRWPRCAVCMSGVLSPSRSGKSLRCVNRECPGRAIACQCSRGYVLIDDQQQSCTAEACGASYVRCPSCELGVLLERRNEQEGSVFWSCSEYGVMLSCGYTQNLDPLEYPPWRCPRCQVGVSRPIKSQNGIFWGCTRFNDLPSCTYTRNSAPPSIRSASSQR